MAFAHEHGHDIRTLSQNVLNVEKQVSSFGSFVTGQVDTLVLVTDPTVNLIPATQYINPPRHLVISARVQLLRTVDETILDDRIVIEELGPSHLLATWIAKDAQAFRDEVVLAPRRLAERIVTEYFLLYVFPEGTSGRSP